MHPTFPSIENKSIFSESISHALATPVQAGRLRRPQVVIDGFATCALPRTGGKTVFLLFLAQSQRITNLQRRTHQKRQSRIRTLYPIRPPPLALIKTPRPRIPAKHPQNSPTITILA